MAEAYRQSGSLAYSASASRGAAYPSGRVRTGDAVFPSLSPRVQFRYSYAVSAPVPVTATGRLGLRAIVSDGAGWSRSLPLSAAGGFRGDRAVATGTLDLVRLRALTRAFERETRTRATTYRVTVVPRIDANARVDGTPAHLAFAPEFAFRFDESRLTPAPRSDGAPPAFDSSAAGTLVLPRPATIGIGRMSATVQDARALGLIAVEIVLGLAILLGAPLLTAARRTPHARVRARLGDRLLVTTGPPQAPGPAVELSDLGDMVRLADRWESPVLTWDDQGEPRYAVLCGGVLYRHRPAHVPRSAPAPAPAPAPA